ncbi:MAG: twin-arginine translocase subunit TatC, partial [Proteobacteria bacterium]|nr:twin-arginine translocase subunit TatC [Pseudomonadota bacterium]
KLCTHVAFFISIPFFILQIYLFIRPGLHEGEKFAVLLYACFVPLLIILAILIVYYFVIPATWKFFLSFEKQKINTLSMPIMLEAKISEYINLIIELIVGFSLAFQMPIILSLLGRLGLITRNQLVKRRKHAIVIIFIVAAILTPPDVLSQIILALPLILLYELSIILIKFTEKYND